jgi:ABC-type taurine transport system ATPase subunit
LSGFVNQAVCMYSGLGWVALHRLVAGFITYMVGSVQSGLMVFHGFSVDKSHR